MKKIVCIFCNQQKEKSKEHIWPRWLQKEIGHNEKTTYQGVHLSPIYPKSIRVHSGESLVFGDICKDCNNGWMSTLEADCKPIIIKLINNRNTITALNKIEREKLSVWAFKTALMINAGSNYRRIIPLLHYSHLYKYQSIIKNIKIDIGFLPERKTLEWRQSQIGIGLMRPADKEFFHELLKQSYKITMQIMSIGIRVSYFPIAKGVHYKISYKENDKNVRIWPFQKNSQFNINHEYTSLDDFDLDCAIIPA